MIYVARYQDPHPYSRYITLHTRISMLRFLVCDGRYSNFDVGFIFKAKHSAEQNKVEAARRQPQLDARWNAFYEEFCQYKEETGNCLIPKVFQENQPLSSW